MSVKVPMVADTGSWDFNSNRSLPYKRQYSHSSKGATRSIRFFILAALALEMQGPRLAGDLRAGLAVFVILAYFLLLTRPRATIRSLNLLIRWPIVPIFAYCVWCATSAAWSETPTEALVQAGLLFLGLILGISYASVEPSVFARQFVWAATVLAVLCWVMVAVAPQVAVLPDVTWRLNGPMLHSQRLSLFVGAGIILWTVMRLKGLEVCNSRLRERLTIVLLVATLLATQTRANTVFVFLVIAVLLFIHLHSWKKFVVASVVAPVLWWFVANFDSLLELVDREGSNTMTLTGRTVIWAGASSMIDQRPLLGYGFGSFFSPLTSWFFTSGYVAPHAHNAWINAAFETGIVGAVLLSVYFLAVMLTDKGVIDRSGFAWPLMLFAVLCGIMGIVYGGKVSTLGVLVTAMAAQALYQRVALRTASPSLSANSRLRTFETSFSRYGQRMGRTNG